MTSLQEYWSVLRLFNFITFRAAGAAVSAILVAFIVGPGVILRLRAMRIRQVVREGTPDTHAGKSSTPTMGGILILFAVAVSTLLWANLLNPYVWVALGVTVAFGAVGFADDYLKVRRRRNLGLTARTKFGLQVLAGEHQHQVLEPCLVDRLPVP